MYASVFFLPLFLCRGISVHVYDYLPQITKYIDLLPDSSLFIGMGTVTVYGNGRTFYGIDTVEAVAVAVP